MCPPEAETPGYISKAPYKGDWDIVSHLRRNVVWPVYNNHHSLRSAV